MHTYTNKYIYTHRAAHTYSRTHAQAPQTTLPYLWCMLFTPSRPLSQHWQIWLLLSTLPLTSSLPWEGSLLLSEPWFPHPQHEAEIKKMMHAHAECLPNKFIKRRPQPVPSAWPRARQEPVIRGILSAQREQSPPVLSGQPCSASMQDWPLASGL